MPKLAFREVGRRKLAWETDCPFDRTNESAIESLALASVRKQRGAIISRDVDVHYDAAKNEGTVLVGMFRPVGRFEVLEEASDATE